MIQNKPVSAREMQSLLETSADKDHPFYYRFAYNVLAHRYIATRCPKHAPVTYRLLFNQLEIEAESPLDRAMKKIEDTRIAYNLSGSF